MVFGIMWVRGIFNVDWIYVRAGKVCVGAVSGGGRICLFEAMDPPIFSLPNTGLRTGTAYVPSWLLDDHDFDSYLSFENCGLVAHQTVIPDLHMRLGAQETDQNAGVFARTLYVPYLVLLVISIIVFATRGWRFVRSQTTEGERKVEQSEPPARA
jgi:hypothetical protein